MKESIPSNIHITSSSWKIQLFNAKCSHSFGALLPKALLTLDHRLDYAEETVHQNPIVCALFCSFREDTDQKHQMLITVAVLQKY
jgi:hypothetical protein